MEQFTVFYIFYSKEKEDKTLQTVLENGKDVAFGGVDLFTTGVLRNIENSSRLGVHSWSGQNYEGEETQAKDYDKNDKAHHNQILYFTTMLGFEKGYDFYFYTIYATFDDEMYIITNDEIIKYNLFKK